jgi:hypothetical protein
VMLLRVKFKFVALLTWLLFHLSLRKFFLLSGRASSVSLDRGQSILFCLSYAYEDDRCVKWSWKYMSYWCSTRPGYSSFYIGTTIVTQAGTLVFARNFGILRMLLQQKKRYFVTAELLVRWTFDRNATIIEQ